MFKEIKTKKELEAFTKFWYNITEETGFVKSKAPLHQSKKYIFFDDSITEFDVEKHEILGTLEINPYRPNGYTTLETEFPFLSYEQVASKQKVTYELDKFGISSNLRGTGMLEEILLVIHTHAQETGAHQYIMLTDYKFFRGLRMGYRIPIINLLDIRNDLEGKPKGIRDGKALVIPSIASVRNEEGEFEQWCKEIIPVLLQRKKEKILSY